MTSAREYALILPNDRSAEQTSVADLVEAFGAMLFRVAYSVLRSRPEAEDVVQDVFVRVLERRGALPEIRDLRVWLVRIAWNLAMDRRRRIRPEQMDAACAAQLTAQDLPADEALAQQRRFAALMAAIGRLPKAERQVLLLSGVQDLSTAEVALVIGKSESATRALLFRARTRLRQRTNGKGGLR